MNEKIIAVATATAATYAPRAAQRQNGPPEFRPDLRFFRRFLYPRPFYRAHAASDGTKTHTTHTPLRVTLIPTTQPIYQLLKFLY